MIKVLFTFYDFFGASLIQYYGKYEKRELPFFIKIKSKLGKQTIGIFN